MNWTVETWVAMTVVPALILAFLVTAVVLFRRIPIARAEVFGEPGLLRAGGVGAVVCAVLAAAGLWWGMYPWQAEYHQYRPIAGTVASVDSRLMPGGDGSTEQKFVVTFTEDPQTPYGILDTRAAVIRPGDYLAITCVRRWQQAGTDGRDCLFERIIPRQVSDR